MGAVNFVNSPERILSRWFIETPQVEYDAIMKEYERAREYIYGDTGILCEKDFENVVTGMFPFRKALWAKLQDKLTMWKESRH